MGAFIAIAVMTRHGAHSCSGNVNTPLGSGPSNSNAAGYGSNGFGFGSGENATYSPNLGLACRLNTAAFAVSIIGAFLFLITALMQIALVRHHRSEKKYGPSPANNYTSGSGRRRFWQRKPKTTDNTLEKDAELGVAGAGVGAAATHHTRQHDLRPSHDTAYTGSTVAAPNAGTGGHYKETNDVAEAAAAHHDNNAHHLPHGTHGGYYTQPQGAGVNPYGYDNTNTRTTASNF